MAPDTLVSRSTRPGSRTTLLIAIAAAVFAVMPVAAAQRGQTSALVGTVRDQTGQPLAGAVLTVESPQLIGGPESASSDREGRFRVVSLQPGLYTLTASAPGFATLQRSDLELGAGLTLTLDLTLGLGTIGSTVEVRDTVPTVDVTTSASTQLIERTLVENLPRTFNPSVVDFINLAPGIADRVALGGAALANPLFLDGTSAASPVQGAPDAEPSVNWVETVQIMTLGSNAEYGEFTAATLNAITRSGANRFSGLGDFWWTRRSWAKFNELLEWNDAAGQLGGPLRRDRIWFFGGADRNEQIARVSAFASQPRTSDEPLVETRRNRLIGKLTTAPTDAMRLEGYLTHGRTESLNGNAAPNVAADALSVFESQQSLQNLRWTWPVSTNTLVEAHAGSYGSSNETAPASPDRRDGPAAHVDNPLFFSVNFPQIYRDERRVTSVRGSLTRLMVTPARGVHEIKTGVEHERASNESWLQWPGNARFLDRNGQPDIVQFWEGLHYQPSHHRTSLFVQDKWQIGAVTLEPGLRAGVYRSAVPNAASATYANHSISPRLGLAWDVRPDHRTVVRAHYGRYHDQMSTRFYEFLDASAEAVLITARVLGPDRFEEVSRSGGPSAIPIIDPDITHSYAAEWAAGIEREIRARLSLKAQYVRRSTTHAMGFIDTGSVWSPDQTLDSGPDGIIGTADDGGPLTVFLNDQSSPERFVLTNPDAAWRTYDGVQVVATRRFFERWSLQGSYAWSRTIGSFDNENGSNAANTDLGRGGHFTNPNRAINSVGRTVFDRPHDIRAFGTYAFPYWGGLRVSGVYRLTSGTPWARLQSADARTQVFQAGIRVEPIGMRTLPVSHEADLRVEKTVTLQNRTVAGLYVDIYNVTNRSVATRVVEFSGPSFGNALRFSPARRFRIGGRISF